MNEQREQKRTETRAIEQFREHIGDPAPLHIQAVYHWNSSDQAQALALARDAEPDVGFMMRLLALCTLPRSNPGDRDRYVRRNGPFTLIMIAGGEVPKLPYGTLPRLLLAWICTEAVRTRSRTLRLGRSLAEFMRKLDITDDSGGSRGDRTRLRNQMQRLFRSTVELSHQTEHGVHAVADRIASGMHLWWNPRRPNEPVLWDSTIELGEKFFNEIIACPVPIDIHILTAMKRSPLGLDLYMWLTYRLFGLSSPCWVSWQQIYQQFGLNPAKVTTRTVDNFRTDVLRELGKLKEAWPALDYRLPRGRLELHPTPSLIPPQRLGAAPVRSGDTAHKTLRRYVHRLLTARPELWKPGRTAELAEAVKTAAARAEIPYDADTVTAAINAGRAWTNRTTVRP